MYQNYAKRNYNVNTSTTPVETSNKDTRLFLFQSVVPSAVAQKSISLWKDGYCTGVIIIFSTDTLSFPAATKLFCISYENWKENENKQTTKWRKQLEIHISYFNPNARKGRVESYSS